MMLSNETIKNVEEKIKKLDISSDETSSNQNSSLYTETRPQYPWLEHPTYWEHTAPQGSSEWLEMRKGRCTGTSNNGKSPFDEKDDIADYIAGIKEPLFSDAAKRRMNLGSQYEPKARRFYEKRYKKEIKEVGFCVPKFNLNIGASVDGIIVGEDGIIEIKCPERLYYELKGKKPQIKFYHYKQMQFNMAVLGKSFCDYIVYGLDGKVFVKRIMFDLDYWKELYLQTVTFWNYKVKPRLGGTYPILPKKTFVWHIYEVDTLNGSDVESFNKIKSELLNNDEVWNKFKAKSGWKHRLGLDFKLENDINCRYYRESVLKIIKTYHELELISKAH